MKISAGKFPISWLALVAVTISAALLLLTAASAQGEAAGEGLAPLAAATESSDDAAPTEQAPAPAPPAEAPEATVETQGAESAIESAGAAVESVAAASSRVAAASSEPVREAASEAASKATGAVSSSATTGLATTVVTATGDHASELLGEVGKTAEAATFEDPPRATERPQPAGTPSSGVLASPAENPLAASPAFRDMVPSVDSGSGALATSYRGFAGAELSWFGAFESLAGIQSRPMSGTTGTPPNDRAPLDRPTPAPGSSAPAAGSTASFFVPLAALLALLALVAPATLRRLGEVPALRPPVPFVCALERPG